MYKTDKQKIVIAESQVRGILALEKVLEFHDVEIISTTDGSEVIDLVKKHKPYLVIMNLLVKEMNGFRLIELLKKLNGDIQPYIVVVSELNTIEYIEECYVLGATAYFTKPYCFADLSEIVQTLRFENSLKNSMISS